MINDVLQDQEGFLWIATKDGLNRYDGYEFKVFTNDTHDPWSISGNNIIKLFEDSAGRIWAASDNAGLNIYDKKTGHFHHLRHDPNDPSSLSGNYINAIVEDTSGYFITAVDKREINMFRLEDEFFNSQQAPQIIRVSLPTQQKSRNLGSDSVVEELNTHQGIVKDAKDRIWVRSNYGLFQLNVQKNQLTLAVEGYSFYRDHAVQNDSIWGLVSSQKSPYWDGIKAAPFSNNLFIGIDKMLDIRVDDNNMWMIWNSTLNGLCYSDWKPVSVFSYLEPPTFFQWEPINVERPIPFPFNIFIVDRSGVLWIGTIGHGLVKMNLKRGLFSHHFPGVSVRNIISGQGNKLYIQDFAKQWFNSDNTCFEDADEVYPWGCFPGDILISKKREYWIRFYDNYGIKSEKYLHTLRKYDPFTKQSQSYKLNWRYGNLQPMIECKDGSIWMAGFNDALLQLDPATEDIISYDIKNGKRLTEKAENEVRTSVDYSTALYEDSDGILWVGTVRGFTKCIRPQREEGEIQITRFKNIPGDQNSLSYNHVTCFLEDPFQPERYVWVSTKGGGVNRLDKNTGTFINLTKKDGLPDNVVYGILPDDDGNIWGSTNKGLFCMSPNKDADGDYQGAYIFRNFSKADGLQENEFNTGAYEKLPNGRLAFGGVNGYNVFDPKEVLSNVYHPPIYITNILVNNQPVSPRDESGILESTIETTQEITLSHLDNMLTLEFATLDFTAPDHNNYRYQMIGADDTWVDAGNIRSATFLNLRPNDYTFRVQGSNSQGIWSDKIAQLKITVLPPWWLTWWAYLVYTLFAVFLFWRYYKFIIKRTKLNQQLVFEKSESEKAKELDQLKTRLYTNLTHEFRTPLTIIIGMVDQIKGSTERNMVEGLDMIKRNGENLLQLVNRMLDLSKIESGKMVLDARQGDIIQTLKNVSDSFVGYAANKDIVIHFLSDLDQKNMIYDDEKIRHIFSNLISNAIKFTLAGGNIYISVRQQENDLLIKVKDTGKGILPHQLDKIFERFYQIESEDNRTSEGTGIGLALCKELVLLMDGKISVQSPPPGSEQGSEFTVLLPTLAVLQDSKSVERSSSNLQAPALTNVVQNQAVAKVPTPISEIQTNEHKESEKVILLVEDNADIVAYVALCLKDYNLIVATNGVEGLEMAIETIPDLIISDVMMPIMDGFQMCERIKKDGRTNHIPVVMLTAKADLESKIEGLEFGANAYISKPFDTDELLLTVRNLFNLRTRLQAHYQDDFNTRELEVTAETLEVDNLLKLDKFVIEVREKIESRINDYGLSVEDLAKEQHFSQSQFSRKLNALIGMTPVKFIRQIRLEKAKGMLLDSAISITAIAFDCGFNDPSYFARVFKKEFGASPQDWREEYKEKN